MTVSTSSTYDSNALVHVGVDDHENLALVILAEQDKPLLTNRVGRIVSDRIPWR